MKKNTLYTFLIAVMGMLILTVTNGMTFTGLTVYDESLIEYFNWTKSTLKFRDFLNLACAAIILPFIGAFVDKFGVKRSLIVGLLLLGLCYKLYAHIATPTQMYLIHIIFAFGVAASGTLVVIIMVSQRVSNNRGAAIGIALAGTSLGGILIPKLAGYLLKDNDWREAFQYESILPFFIIILVLLFVKDKDKFESSGKKKTQDLTELDFKAALKTRPFWLLAFIGFFCYYAILGLMGNLFLYMRELSFSTETAINALGLISLVILVAKLVSGVLTDYVNRYVLFRIQIFVMLLGAIGFAMYSDSMVWFAIPLMAIGWGGLYTLINYIIITTFGVDSAGKIGGSISTFESLGAGLGIWLSGMIADQSGSYQMSFIVVSAFLFIAFIFSFLLKPLTEETHAGT